MDRFDCPVCGATFEGEDADEVAKKVMDHVGSEHPNWGTKDTSGSWRKAKPRGGLWKRGKR
jgi:hypothetical protein